MKQINKMRFKPATLFLVTTVLCLLLGILTKSKSVDIQLHDIYFFMSYLHVAIIVSLLTGLITLTYWRFESAKRPIKSKTGFWHFGLFIIGILLFVVTINLPVPVAYYDTNNSYTNYIYGQVAMLFIGVALLLTSVIVFLYGLINAILVNNNES